jgi:hypothetical protein
MVQRLMVEKHLPDWHLGPYTVHFIFFVANEWTLWAKVFHYTWLEGLARVKHSSLLGLLVGYKQNKALWIQCLFSIAEILFQQL